MAAVRAIYARLEGHFTFVVIHRDHPDHLVGVRHQTPMVVGLGEGENFLASNLAAFLAETRRVQFPDDGEIVLITPDGVEVVDAATGEPVELDIVDVDWDDDGRRALAATRRSCSRRSTSSPRASPRRSATACATATSCSTGSG